MITEAELILRVQGVVRRHVNRSGGGDGRDQWPGSRVDAWLAGADKAARMAVLILREAGVFKAHPLCPSCGESMAGVLNQDLYKCPACGREVGGRQLQAMERMADIGGLG